MTLADTLQRLGLTTRPIHAPGEVGRVVLRDGREVYRGPASGIRPWLERTGQVPRGRVEASGQLAMPGVL